MDPMSWTFLTTKGGGVVWCGVVWCGVGVVLVWWHTPHHTTYTPHQVCGAEGKHRQAAVYKPRGREGLVLAHSTTAHRLKGFTL